MPLITKNVANEGFVAVADEDYISADDLSGNLQASGLYVDIEVDKDARALQVDLPRISVIRIPFEKFSDGRGFSLARQFRELGYTGRIRAFGHIVSDQFAFALQSGIDEVEIDDALAQRQPEDYWKEAAGVRYGYRTKLANRE